MRQLRPRNSPQFMERPKVYLRTPRRKIATRDAVDEFAYILSTPREYSTKSLS